MDDAKFARIFGQRRGRTRSGATLLLRDADFIAELKRRISDHAARDDRGHGSAWAVDFSPTRTDDLTERSMFDAVLTSATEGERRLPVTVGREWVEFGGGAMESSVRANADNVERALINVFRRVVLRWPYGTVDPARVRVADA